METASLSTLSPNTNMLRVGSTFRAWNIASVATGSTADMRDPNVKLEKTIIIFVTLKMFNKAPTSDICLVDMLHPSVEKTQ